MSGLVPRHQVHLAHHAVVMVDQFPGVGEELLAEGRQVRLDDARVAFFEQGLAQLVLQVADGQGYGGLGAMRPFRGGMEPLQFHDPDEMAQLDDPEVWQHGKFHLSNNSWN